MTPLTPTGLSPYYIHAPQSIDDGAPETVQLHRLCHELNRAGCPAYLSDAPAVCGQWWTPLLSARLIAAHYVAGLVPISIQGGDERTRPGVQAWLHAACTDPAHGDALARLRLVQQAPAAGSDHDVAPDLALSLPWFDPAVLQVDLPGSPRAGVLVYSGHLPGPQYALRPEHAALTDVSPYAAQPLSQRERWQRLATAQVLYAYAGGSVVTEARLLGCTVIYVANDHQLQAMPQHPMQLWGTFLNDSGHPLGAPDFSTEAFRSQLTALAGDGQAPLRRLIDVTQQAAAALAFDKAWNTRQIFALGALVPASAEQRAALADRVASERLCTDYPIWRERATPAEVYGDIGAELVGSGQVAAPTVHVFGHGRDGDALADTMDALAQCWLKPRRIVIHADMAPPVPVAELGDDVRWIGPGDAWAPDVGEGRWIVLLEAGCQPEPYAFIELLAATRAHPEARMVYAAHDAPWKDGQPLPHFTGGCNIEWLRGTNYLGGMVAVRADAWASLPDAGRYASAYRLALRSSAEHGAASVHYVDQLLSHGAAQLADGQEAAEFAVARQELERLYPGVQLQATEQLGCWRVLYPEVSGAITLVVPTGKQLGYLRGLLASCVRYYPNDWHEALLVVQDEDLAAVQSFIEQWEHGDCLPLRVLSNGGGGYSHARAINLGLRGASTEAVLVCDDDVEWLDTNALPQLRRLFAQERLAVAAPRLVLQVGEHPLITAGPHMAGEGAQLLNYCGEQNRLAERGMFNRLQMSQDVAGVHGACWLARKAAVLEVGGLDETHTPVWQAVTDLGYRLQQADWRLVWTPHAGALHAGSATLNAVRQQPAQALALEQLRVDEARYLQKRWVSWAGQHLLYSKHLMGTKAFQLETRVVASWSANHHRRPTAIATPLKSGAGQYRVVEPLNAVQQAGKAQTCVVLPEVTGLSERRVLTALDVARWQPKRILVQHSITDEDIANLRAIRLACPDAFIVQLFDDLGSDLPPSHPNYVFGQREGHARARRALALCDRLIVSTQPLADYYADDCKDIRRVPNALDPRFWGGKRRVPTPRKRLRVGWAGAAQHLGDLRLVQDVVKALADRVDWVFMGMCPDELRPCVKEFHRFVSYKDYPDKLASLDLDIAIAPLEDHLFNACKSNLRLLEFGAMGWPVVCSDVYPFRTDDPPVLRVPNDTGAWLAALERLIGDAGFRQAQGDALHRWVRKNYMIERHVEHWFRAIFDAPVTAS